MVQFRLGSRGFHNRTLRGIPVCSSEARKPVSGSGGGRGPLALAPVLVLRAAGPAELGELALGPVAGDGEEGGGVGSDITGEQER